MVRHLMVATGVMMFSLSFAAADEFPAFIKKVDGAQVTFGRLDLNGKPLRAIYELATLPVAKDVKVAVGKGSISPYGRKLARGQTMEAGVAIEGGLQNDLLRKANDKHDVFALISISEDNNTITRILVLKRQVSAGIKKVDGAKVTFKVSPLVSIDDTFITLPVTKDVKVAKLKRAKAFPGKAPAMFEAGDPIEGGLKNEIFLKLDNVPFVPLGFSITTSEDNKTITQILLFSPSRKAQPPSQQSLGGLDPMVVAAWNKAGANFCWFVPTFLNMRPSLAKFPPANPAAVPGFHFAAVPQLGTVVFLPVPTKPFGLNFISTTAKKGQTEVTDAFLHELIGMEQLQELHFTSKQVTDAGLNALAKLTKLQSLSLWDAQVTDAGLKQLSELERLEKLDLGGTQVTDAGIKELAGLGRLRVLHLGGTKVTGAGLKELESLKQLQALELHHLKVTDADLKALAGLQDLQRLNLWNTQVTDAGLQELARLEKLRNLVLSGNKITDANLQKLVALRHLGNLSLTQTMVTAAGVADLQKAMPNCKIAWSTKAKGK